MAEMLAGAFFSAFFQQAFQKMDCEEVRNFIRGKKQTEGLLQKLRITLLSVGKVYEDAEEKQIRDSDVKQWLSELKDTVYHAQDLLDEIKTQALRHKLPGSSTSKVKQFISASFHAFDKSVDPRIEEIIEKLEFIAKQKDDLNLKVGARHRVSQTLPSTSLVEDSGVYGRDEDKETIIQLLLSNDPTSSKIGVIPIMGMGGLGKTTLAQLLYNDVRVKKQFEPRAWVCVTEEFDIRRITQTIYGSVTPQTCDITDLDQLQVKLQQALSGKKFLFVLDDVWDENYSHWDFLRRPFKSGADGSKIIVTTRNAGVASMMGTLQTHHLKKICDEDCWLLFSKHAFRSVSAHPNLEVIGRQIVRKCQGLPLAAKSLGALLRYELNIEDWENVLKSDIWELSYKETNILPALWLSYRYLPLHLKPCFAYCSIFPKDYEFTKIELVLLWMAEDLLQPTKSKMVEEVGEENFNDLISRSFFQQSRVDVSSHQPFFTMHDLTNDLAKFVSGEFCVRWEDNGSLNIFNKTRHFSYLEGSGLNCGKFEALYEAKYLHTLLSLSLGKQFGSVYSKIPQDLSKLQCLRALNLSGHHNITKLPNSISKLKHLRHLNISYTSIKKLPDTMCTLYNLQTLLLLGCHALTQLPTNLGRLINLRHLDIKGTKLKKMPPQMGKFFKHLRTLSYFVLDKVNGGNIVELKEFQYLRGMLHISGLQNIVHAKDAVEANLREKYLDELILEWGNGRSHSQNHREVLNNLQPHTNLKALEIDSYWGTRFPSWVGDESFSNLVSVRLVSCGYCLSLPSLGQLPSLEKLEIVGLKEVVSIGPEFYSGGFPNLCELELRDCPKLSGRFPLDYFPKLEKLTIMEANVESLATSQLLLSLTKLDIRECPNLVCFPDGGLQAPNLTSILIWRCKKLRSLPEEMHTLLPSLETMSIHHCPELESFLEGGLPSKLRSLYIIDCKKVIAKRMQWGLQRLTSLKDFGVGFEGCEEVDSFPEEGLLPTTLTSLSIYDCLNLKTVNGKELRHLTSLQTLWIRSCPELQCLPDEGLPTSLSNLQIYDCPKLQCLPDAGLPTSLSQLRIIGCPKLQCLPDAGLPTSLSNLEIWHCPLLEQRCQRETGEDWPKIAHIPDIYIHGQRI